MKQEQKTQITRDRILSVAIREFGTKNYESASVNSICNSGQISKGLFYHNYKNKDELYLQCVSICFEEMTHYLKTHLQKSDSIQAALKNLLEQRQQFFTENPYLANIFFHSILLPPQHLAAALGEIRKDFDQFCSECYLDILKRLTLRDGITEAMALEYFSVFLKMFNGYFQEKASENQDFNSLIQAHEGKLSGVLDIFLYGIAKQ